METKTLLVAAIVLLTACTDDDRAKRVLEEAGYTEIHLTGYEPFTCSEDDWFATGFTAVGPTGHTTTGTVCCGAFKSCTIRID